MTEDSIPTTSIISFFLAFLHLREIYHFKFDSLISCSLVFLFALPPNISQHSSPYMRKDYRAIVYVCLLRRLTRLFGQAFPKCNYTLLMFQLSLSLTLALTPARTNVPAKHINLYNYIKLVHKSREACTNHSDIHDAEERYESLLPITFNHAHLSHTQPLTVLLCFPHHSPRTFYLEVLEHLKCTSRHQ